ncbi:hypothetical protein J4221_05455 [Candidatus Pacearchaeota archaeon]|nr:hypothetical protein [Candidatus Pacearchaeota archaeon]
MVSLNYWHDKGWNDEWNNPRPREKEREKLERLLQEINKEPESEKIKREYMESADNTEEVQDIFDVPHLSDTERAKLAYELLERICIGEILRNEGDKEEQLKHYRRLEMVYDVSEKLEIDPASLFAKQLVYSLRKKQEE